MEAATEIRVPNTFGWHRCQSCQHQAKRSGWECEERGAEGGGGGGVERIGQHIERSNRPQSVASASPTLFTLCASLDATLLAPAASHSHSDLSHPAPAPCPCPSHSLTVLKKLLKIACHAFYFHWAPQLLPSGQKRKIKTFNAFFITHCHCPPLATPPTPPTPLSAMRSVAPSVCSADPGATLFVQATCLNKSSPAPLLLLPLLQLLLCLFSTGGFPAFPA